MQLNLFFVQTINQCCMIPNETCFVRKKYVIILKNVYEWVQKFRRYIITKKHKNRKKEMEVSL